MADLLGYRNWAVTNAGNIVPTSAVEVRIKSSGLLATLFQDAAGTMGLSNPFTAELDGSFEFFTDRDLYDLIVGSGPSQETTPLNLSPVNSNGEWTPIPADDETAGNLATFLSSFGTFAKVGRLVLITCNIVDLDTTGLTGGNDLWIRGLPFGTLGGGQKRFIGGVQLGQVNFAGSPGVILGNAATAVRFNENLPLSGFNLLIVSQFTSGTADIKFSLVYETDE